MLTLDFSSAASSPLSVFLELRRVRAWLWIRYWPKGLLCLVWSSIQTSKTFCMWAIRRVAFHVFHHPCVHWSSATISFKNVSFVVTTWLTVWHKRSNFPPLWALNMPSSLSLIFFLAFDLKWGTWMLEHIEAVNWPNFSVAVSKGTGRPQERTRTGEWLVSGAAWTQIFMD